MDSRIDSPLVTRARMLLLAALGAGVWVVLSVFGIGGPAQALDSQEPGDSLLGAIVGTLSDETAVPAILEQAIEPPAALASDAVVATLTIAESVAAPALEQTVVADTLGLLGAAATVVLPAPVPDRPAETQARAAASGSASAVPVGAQDAPSANQQDDTRTLPREPGPAPVPSDAAALGQAPGSQPLVAAFLGSPQPTEQPAGTNPQENDALPSAPTFDNDCSPD